MVTRVLKSTLLGTSDSVTISVDDGVGYLATVRINNREVVRKFPFDGHNFPQRDAESRHGRGNAIKLILDRIKHMYRNYELRGNAEFDDYTSFCQKRSAYYTRTAGENMSIGYSSAEDAEADWYLYHEDENNRKKSDNCKHCGEAPAEQCDCYEPHGEL